MEFQWKSKYTTEYNLKHIDKVTSPILASIDWSKKSWYPQDIPNKNSSFFVFHNTIDSNKESTQELCILKTYTISSVSKLFPYHLNSC